MWGRKEIDGGELEGNNGGGSGEIGQTVQIIWVDGWMDWLMDG